jgi:hypothetical protein
MSKRQDGDGTPLCKYTLGKKKCFGIVLQKNWLGFCVNHSKVNIDKFDHANRLVKRGWHDKWFPVRRKHPERPQCKQMVYSGSDRKRCSYKISELFDDDYCHMHGPGL